MSRRSAAPMAASDQHDAQVQHQRHDRQEVAHAGQTDHAAREIVELLADAQPLEQGQPLGRCRGKHQGRVEQRPQYEADRQIAGQKRGHHTDAQHRQAHDPVAEIRGQQQAQVRIAQVIEHQEIRDERESQRRGVDGHGSQVFAQHDVEIAGRYGQQQLVGALPAFIRPDAHRDGRNEHQQDERQIFVQLVEIRQVRIEEVAGPKGGKGAQ